MKTSQGVVTGKALFEKAKTGEKLPVKTERVKTAIR